MKKKEVLGSLLSGFLLILSFPNFDLEFLAWFALVPLFYSIEGKGVSRSFKLGFLTGILSFLGIIYWIFVAVHTYGNVPLILSGLILLLLVRPMGYFARIQASIERIRESLGQRLRKGRWPSGSSGSRRRHWLQALIRNAVAFLGNAWKNALMEAFDRLICLGVIPVSRSIKPATGIVFEPPYRGVP